MKFDRSLNADGLGKYALLKLRNYPKPDAPGRESVDQALSVLSQAGMLDMGYVGTESEFFLMRLKDKYSLKALLAYQRAVCDDEPTDTEYAQEILDMANRAGPNSQWCKKPD